MKSASLDLILEANGRKTGDQIRAERAEEDALNKQEFFADLPASVNGKTLRNIRRSIKRMELKEERAAQALSERIKPSGECE